MQNPYHPHGTGFDALDELDAVDWSVLRHAYGTGIVLAGPQDVPLGISGDVSRALADLRTDPRTAIAHGLYSNICHQGTVYEATAYAVPFIAAVAVGDIPDDIRAQLVALLGHISIGARYPAASGAHAGALGDKVDVIVTDSLAASMSYVSAIRAPALVAVIDAVQALLAESNDGHREDVESAVDALSTARLS